MTEDVKDDVVEDKQDPIEVKAMSMGWRPKEEWNGDESEFIPADEFVRRKPLFDKIEHQSRKLKTVEDSLKQLADHHQKVREIEYQRALKEIKESKRTALKEGDTALALDLEDQMESLQQEFAEEQKKAPQVTQPQTGPSPEFLAWVNTNQWYVNNSEMHDFAEGAAAAFVQRAQIAGKTITEQDVFNAVTDKVKKAYPEAFGTTTRSNGVASVATGDRVGRSVRETFKLTPEQERIAENFEKNKVMSRSEYIKELKALEGIE